MSGVPAILPASCWRKASPRGGSPAPFERESDGAIAISGSRKDIRIEPAPPDLMFRWMVTIDGRKRGAISLAGVLRQVRQALDPGYAANRVRVAISPAVPS